MALRECSSYKTEGSVTICASMIMVDEVIDGATYCSFRVSLCEVILLDKSSLRRYSSKLVDGTFRLDNESVHMDF